MQQNLTNDKPLIDKMYDLLESEKQAKTFYELANAIISSDIEGDERVDILARLYTTLNMDGRFLSVGQNFWGLKSWYPVEQHDEEVASKITPKRKRKQTEDDYDDEDYDDTDDFDDLDDDLEDDDYDDDDLEDFDDDEEAVDEDYDDDDEEEAEEDDELDLDEDDEED